MLDLQDSSRHPSQESLTGPDAGHLHPGHSYINGHRHSPSSRHNGSPLARSPSPRRRGHQYIHHDIGFSDTVSNVVEMVKETRHPRHGNNHPRYPRGSWSASTSPARSPSPSRYGGHLSRSKRTQLPYPTYGTTSLCQRSRSPSPARLQEMRERDRLGYGIDMGGAHVQHSYPTLASRRAGIGRRLPPTPSKPSTLQLKPTNINFPKLNASPTHTHHSTPHSVHSLPHHRDLLRDPRDVYYSSRERERDRERFRDRDRLHEYDVRYEYRDRERELYERERDREREVERERLEYIAPLSFEQALAMGRTGRVLPSPVLNGFKPKSGLNTRHSDSDEEDWC
ncbi:hypothetical protein AWZ03_010615 [Drosophila navojoa]|uniref:Uncharacterized protein n=2 Tax=Drosophila navojoa TaxID=7232 RepID=A0A484B563_DRONA|nr:hypothetical protein AWZ03_010615 [Drosophila navojoa]